MSLDWEQQDIWQQRSALLRSVLTPARPVNDRELFAGRTDQLLRASDTLYAPGEHGAIFGERGVGKTSLAIIAEQIANLSGRFAVRVNCTASDDLTDIWRRIGEGVDRAYRQDQRRDPPLFGALDGTVQGAIPILTAQSVTTHDASIALEMIADVRPLVILLDEFDRVEDPNVHVNLVDLMKTISDHNIAVTIFIVGVAADVDRLLEEHKSVGRGLNEIEMQRMSLDELTDILKRTLNQAEMGVSDEAAQFIGQLSAGLPHYVHLLGLYSGLAAVDDRTNRVELDHVIDTLGIAVQRAQQHVSQLYHQATHSTRANRYRQVLLAVALTPTDERGYFAPGDLRYAMSVIMDEQATIPQFSDHLLQFATDERGPVVHKTGVVNRPRYRIAEPLLVPYVAMRGVTDELINQETLRRLLAERGGS